MRGIKVCLILGLALLLTGFSGKIPTIMEGVYDCKPRTFTYFDLIDAGREKIPINSNIAEITGSKPDQLEVGFDSGKLREPKFGFIKLGNNEQKVWFLIGADSNNAWSEIYVDRNFDNRITAEEKVRGVETSEGRYKGCKVWNALAAIPVPVRTFFKGQNSEIQKKLYYLFAVTTFLKEDQSDLQAEVYSASFLSGELKADFGKEIKTVSFRIVDANGNGCFNDYGKDLLFIDSNFNGYFERKESRPLTEFFDYTGPGKKQIQLRLVVPAIPAKIAVIGVNQNCDCSLLEAKTDPVEEEKTESEKGI